ncbi:glycosyltransferase family 4 protein [Alkalisalibacterium limincola]|uniref:Glycosyltransferase family 4 protein n=1 Tax=Alkalisalibacterium limincola TaxID=2699169 RepID=A0A5C8KYP6_9GAMM|nr:glycosyltransferase family 4 protein [Alkalisalibacterium limincola]TXK64477.1 glycosyltransferase family 4 protein [Alkalisalibacterium limincola]
MNASAANPVKKPACPGASSDPGGVAASSATLPPVRVLMVVQGYFPSVGGAERQVVTLGRALQEGGHHVEVLCPRFDDEHPAGAGSCKGLPVWRINYPRWPVAGTLVLLSRQLYFLWSRRHTYDAIHVQIADQMGALAAVAGRWLGKPVVVKFAGSWEREHGSLRRDGFLPKVLRMMLRRASAIQATSLRFMDELGALGFRADRLHWLPNAVDLSHFRKRPDEVRRVDAQGRRTLLFIGRLEPDKALDVLLEAWSRSLGSTTAAWRLRLVGEGGQEARLRELARTLGVESSVEFVGEIPLVEDELWGADASVLPSLREGLSNALLEAMAAGLPVIATRVSGSEDFIRTGENGWLCEPGDVASLTAALDALGATSPQVLARLGARGRQVVEARASLPVVTGQLLSLYRGNTPTGESA